MNSLKIHPLWLLIVFAAGCFVWHILTAQRDMKYELAGIDSRLVQLETRNLEIEDAKANRESRFKWAERVGTLISQLLSKFHLWH